MRTRSAFSALSLLLLLGSAACSDAGDPLTIEATGAAAARAFLDRNGNNQVDEGVDTPAVGLRIALLRGSDTIATSLTDASGTAFFPSLPVGSYRLAVSPAVLGDSLRLLQLDSARVTVAVADTPLVSLTLGYPAGTAAQVQTLPLGRIVTLEGVALHAANVFGDSTLHVLDSTGVARVVGIPARIAAAAGDSVRVLGRIGSRLGRPALVESSAFVLGPSQPPVARVVSAAEAASARGGQWDGNLVQVNDTRILSITALPGGDLRLRVIDGTGPLEIILDQSARISTEPFPTAGAELDVTGILVPKEGASEWVLKPRSGRDLVVTIPSVTIAEARTLPAGTLVSFDAIALNGLATFGDNTVHLDDGSGTIRAVDLSASSLFAGDSVHVRGFLTFRDGQPVLSPSDAIVLDKASVPVPKFINTQVAATADDGRLDAALVEVRNAVVDSIRSAGGDVVLQVNDGSGPLTVVIDRDTGIGTGGLITGMRLNLTGVLVPTGTGSWVLKPRSPADIVRL